MTLGFLDYLTLGQGRVVIFSEIFMFVSIKVFKINAVVPQGSIVLDQHHGQLGKQVCKVQTSKASSCRPGVGGL